MNYTISEENKTLYAGIYVLEYLQKLGDKGLNVFLDRDHEDLEPVLEWLMARKLITINSEHYQIADTGHELLDKFRARYSEYLNVYDIYCAVDLAAGEFAFSSYPAISDQSAWQHFLADERWEDLRVAVACFKKMDPIEIVFMSFINEGRFGRNNQGWQFDLLIGSVWHDILAICETALHVKDLGWSDADGEVSGEDVITEVIGQGTAIMQELHQQLPASPGIPVQVTAEDRDEVRTVTYETYDYEPYYDPYYVSPLWLVPLILL